MRKTDPRFLKLLADMRREPHWFLHHGRIRRSLPIHVMPSEFTLHAGEACPLSSGMDYNSAWFVEVGCNHYGFSMRQAVSIAKAADADPHHKKFIRRALLAAAGLQEGSHERR